MSGSSNQNTFKKSNGQIKMAKFDEIKPLLSEEAKETLMEIGFNYLQTRKNGKGVDSEWTDAMKSAKK